MKQFVILLAFFASVVGCGAPPPTVLPTPRPQNENALRERIHRYFTRRANRQEFSGVVLVARQGEIILKNAYGFADTQNKTPNTIETRFQLASVGKTITATAIMQLAARGQLELQAPISNYLADIPPTWENITVAHLLSHTSGIPDYFSFDEFENEMNLTPEGVIAIAKKYPLEFDAGSEFEYSNTNFVLLGKIIETVSGKSYAQFLRENIFDPLQMNATGREENSASLAVGYVAYAQPARTFPITNALGDGDLLSTVDDMFKFDRALYDEKFLTRELREKMFAPVGGNNYALGWETAGWNGKRVVSHSGGINGFATELMRFPDEDAVIIILSNLESFDAVQAAWEVAEMAFP